MEERKNYRGRQIKKIEVLKKKKKERNVLILKNV